MAKQLVTKAERLWIAENAVRELGAVIKYPVIDIKKSVARIREQRASSNLSPYVEIQPISPDMHKVPNKLNTFQKDPDTGVLYGIAITEDTFGNPRWQKIQLHDSMSLNLDKADDAKIWSVLRFYPELQGSPWQVDNPYYKVYDPTDAALAEMGEIAAMRKAFNHIEKIQDKPREMVMFARFLGEDLRENANENIVIGTLQKFAKNHPLDFNRKWESKIRSFGERFHSGVAIGIITQDADRGFIFRNMQLGQSEEDSINFLSGDSNIMGSLNNDLSEKDILINSISKAKIAREKLSSKVDDGNDGEGDPDPGEDENKETETANVGSGDITPGTKTEDEFE